MRLTRWVTLDSMGGRLAWMAVAGALASGEAQTPDIGGVAATYDTTQAILRRIE